MILLISFLFVIIVFFSLLEEKLEESNKQFAFLIVVFFMALVVGFRPDDIDNDYLNYVQMYYRGSEGLVEITFSWISFFVYYVFDSVIFLFLSYAFISMILKALAIKKLTNLYFLSLLFYLGTYYLLHDFNQIRVAVAAGFFLLGIPYLTKGKRKKYLLYSLLATLFHYSAGLLFFLSFLNNAPFKKWQLFLYGSIVPLCYLLYIMHINLLFMIPIPYIEEKFRLYEALQNNGIWDEINVFNLVLLVKIAIIYFLIWKVKLITKYNSYVVILLKIEILSIASFVLLYELPVLAFRVSELLGIVECILIPLLYYTIKPNVVSKIIVHTVALAFLLISVYYNHIIFV